MKHIMCTNGRDEFFKLTALDGETYEVVDGSNVIETSARVERAINFEVVPLTKLATRRALSAVFIVEQSSVENIFCREHRIRSKFELVRCKSI